jgi:hypothetical protein
MESAIQHMRAAAAEDDRIAIRPRASDPADSYDPVRSGDVFDDDRLSQRTSHPLGNYTPEHICGATRRVWHDHGYWT